MDTDLTKKVEAVLFASGRFMDAAHIAELLQQREQTVLAALGALQERYLEHEGALRVVEEEGAWKLHVQDTYLDLVSRVVSDTEVSGPVLETLAVIAWRSPVLQASVVDIRGTNAYEHIKELVERGFIKKEPAGRTYQLRITEKFFDYFDIEGRDDIKKVFQQVEEEHRKKEMELELQQKRLEHAMNTTQEPDDVPNAEKPEKQQPLSRPTVDLDRLDEVLEKSRRTREHVGEELASARKNAEALQETPSVDVPREETPTEEPVDAPPTTDTGMSDEEIDARLEELREQARRELAEEQDEDVETVRERARRVREQVEEDTRKL